MQMWTRHLICSHNIWSPSAKVKFSRLINKNNLIIYYKILVCKCTGCWSDRCKCAEVEGHDMTLKVKNVLLPERWVYFLQVNVSFVQLHCWWIYSSLISETIKYYVFLQVHWPGCVNRFSSTDVLFKYRLYSHVLSCVWVKHYMCEWSITCLSKTSSVSKTSRVWMKHHMSE